MTYHPHIGVCYYPEHWDKSLWYNDARYMVDLNISTVRIGEFAWSRLEPKSNQYHFDWLHEAIEILANAGLNIILGTPTATPPKWLVDKMPDMMMVDANGRRKNFTSRRHYCHSHLGYRQECARIVTKLAEEFATYDSIIGWQIDNEYACHDSALSYSPAALKGFQQWLQQKYQSIEQLNIAWGGVFWSLEYQHFSDIELPVNSVAQLNPTHALDFYRYTSDQILAFHKIQYDIIRSYDPNSDIIHNFMGRIIDFDHFDIGAYCDIAAWDSYPLGFLQDRIDCSDNHKLRFMRAGDPDFQAFHHDLYRAVGQGRMMVMEQQPAPVNWSSYNPMPRDNMICLWALEAMVHGAESVFYFRFRQLPFAQEQMHGGLLHTNNSDNIAIDNIKTLNNIMKKIHWYPPTTQDNNTNKVAIIFDYQSAWAWQIQPQGINFNYFNLVFHYYQTCRQLGLNIDFINTNCKDFSQYCCVIIPALFAKNATIITHLKQSKVPILIGPRSFSKTNDFHIPLTLAPDLPKNVLDITIDNCESLPLEYHIPVSDIGYISDWREFITVGDTANVILQDNDGQDIFIKQDNIYYCGAITDKKLTRYIIKEILNTNVLYNLPDGLRIRHYHNIIIIFNYDNITYDLKDYDLDKNIIYGNNIIAPAQIVIIKR